MAKRRGRRKLINSPTINVYFLNDGSDFKNNSGKSEQSVNWKNTILICIFLIILTQFVYIIARDAGIIEAIKTKWDILEPITAVINWIFEFFLFFSTFRNGR